MSNADELKKLGELLESGVLSKEEFEIEKEKLLKKTSQRFKLGPKQIKYLFLVVLVTLGIFIITNTSLTSSFESETTSADIFKKLESEGISVTFECWNGFDCDPDKKVDGYYQARWFKYSEHANFMINEIAPKGGQFYICKTKSECDPIWNHYDTSPLRGPYVFRSKDGKLVAQLNSTLSIDTGAKFRDVFENLDNIVVTDH